MLELLNIIFVDKLLGCDQRQCFILGDTPLSFCKADLFYLFKRLIDQLVFIITINSLYVNIYLKTFKNIFRSYY